MKRLSSGYYHRGMLILFAAAGILVFPLSGFAQDLNGSEDNFIENEFIEDERIENGLKENGLTGNDPLEEPEVRREVPETADSEEEPVVISEEFIVPPPLLLPGIPVSGSVDVAPGGTGYETFRFLVPDDAVAVSIALTNAEGDLDLYLKHGADMYSYDEADAFSASSAYNEMLYLSRISDSPLKSGEYYLDIAYRYQLPPVSGGRSVDTVGFTVTVSFTTASQIPALVPGTPRKDTLEPGSGMQKLYTVNIPQWTRAFRIDLFDLHADLDLAVAYENPVFTMAGADYRMESFLAKEHLVILPEGNQFYLRSGRYTIAVHEQHGSGRSEPFSIQVSLGEAVPRNLLSVPSLPRPSEELEYAMTATVEVVGKEGRGSGVLVSAEGHVLTSFHVIETGDGKISPRIYIAGSISHYYPPEELFSAEVLEYDRELDLALLKINSGLYGQPLPGGYQFPLIRLAETVPGKIGQPVTVIGYPAIGGTGSLASVSVGRGIISGFERTERGTMVKTDAIIGEGSSGGAVINVYHELIGIPAVVRGEPGGRIGFFIPVSAIPEQWKIRYPWLRR